MGNRNSALNAKIKAKEWQWQLRTEAKLLEKEIQRIQKEENKLQKEIKAQAERGNVQSVQLLARQIVRSRKSVTRLEHTKANMHAVSLQLSTSIATMTTTNSLRVSADVMKKMNRIAGSSGASDTMGDLRREMARVAEQEEMVEEALHDSDDEREAATEVQKLLEEMALAKMGPLASSSALAEPPAAEPTQPVAAVPEKPARQPILEAATSLPPSVALVPPPQPAPPTAAPPLATDTLGKGALTITDNSVAPSNVATATPPAAIDDDDADLMLRLAALKQ